MEKEEDGIGKTCIFNDFAVYEERRAHPRNEFVSILHRTSAQQIRQGKRFRFILIKLLLLHILSPSAIY